MMDLPQPTIAARTYTYAWINIMVAESSPFWRGEVAICGNLTRFEQLEDTSNGFRDAWTTATFLAIKKDVANFDDDSLREACVEGWEQKLREMADRLARGDW